MSLANVPSRPSDPRSPPSGYTRGHVIVTRPRRRRHRLADSHHPPPLGPAHPLPGGAAGPRCTSPPTAHREPR
eukprot:CAMPEP_0115841060 /NCGR_PEP_ID=MMETSP0287-20121206/7095_1 /TAXON_ID=412157 /ORGANISM="Chrysochromulina rotalis, Strain UIO044" /LENGTH=72 /DNA_ID=CAMNT_0003294697 /DNA_START=168 /DNA_END=382 /DNA_ORIENTATION=+